MLKKPFIFKEYTRSHISDDDAADYDYIDADDLVSHFFHLKFIYDDEVILLGCHLYMRFKNGFGEWPEYKFYFVNGLGNEEQVSTTSVISPVLAYKLFCQQLPIDYSLLNSNDDSDLENEIEKIITSDASDESYTLDEFIGDEFLI